jgi:hypothetical protein
MMLAIAAFMFDLRLSHRPAVRPFPGLLLIMAGGDPCGRRCL